MFTQPTYRSLSVLEKTKIDNEIKEHLVEHWYKKAATGVVTTIFSSTAVSALFYNNTKFFLLLSWLLGFYLTLVLIATVNFLYKKFKAKLDIQKWNFILSFLVVVCTVFWGACIFFNSGDLVRQFILLAVLFMVAASFSMVTVGMFKLCVICISFVLLPSAIWFFLNSNFYYKLTGGFIVIYIAFLLGMNRKSSEWLIDSLKLSKMLAFSTHQANFDLITDLPNQQLLTHYIEQVISSVKYTDTNFALICFGINRLEIFNNSLGYQAGDLIINSIAKRLQAQLSTLNQLDETKRILARPRPDAFAILIVPIKLTDINKEINQLFLALDNFHFQEKESRLTASIGVTIYPRDSINSERLLSNAYAAMFEARSKGGNQIAFYKATMTNNAPLLLELETDLNEALHKKELELYYQPLINLQKGVIAGVEALLRWNHPSRGNISPLDFLSIAEETGLIIPLSEWVLEEAAFQTTLWHKQGFDDLKVAVNLSPKQLRQGNLITTIDQVLKKTGLSPEKLELELTETAILDESLSPLINEISKRGISLAIDDFGTGYSGLSYLKHFHVDKIKIDKSFIHDVISNNDSATIVTATLTMAKELGIKTLAEGVETKEQLEFLRDRGCQYIQGYYFSKPVSATELEALLNKGISEKL